MTNDTEKIPRRTAMAKIAGAMAGGTLAMGGLAAADESGAINAARKKLFPQESKSEGISISIKDNTGTADEVNAVATSTESLKPVDMPINKVHVGNTLIDLYKVGIRMEPRVPASHDDPKLSIEENKRMRDPNHVPPEDIQKLNNVKVNKAQTVIVTNAPIVEGNPVGDNLQEKDWIKLEAELTDGEKTFLYISRSSKTYPDVRDLSGQDVDYNGPTINLPKEHIGKITVDALKLGSSSR